MNRRFLSLSPIRVLVALAVLCLTPLYATVDDALSFAHECAVPYVKQASPSVRMPGAAISA